MTLLQLFLVILGLGVIAALVRGAPSSLLAESFKTILVYLLLVIVVLAVLAFFGIWHAIASFHI